MDGANRMEIAESYVKQLETASSDEEISRLILDVIKILDPIAQNDPNFERLRYTGLEIIKPSEELTKSSQTSQTTGKKKRLFFTAFIEVFQIFKCGFKYEEIVDYEPNSEL